MRRISRLGFGCMRFPMAGEQIDKPQLRKMIDYALDGGVNYFDTAYMYHDGESEVALGELLVSRHARDRFLLADKLAGWKIPDDGGPAAMMRMVDQQLKRLQADHIDYYLVHTLSEKSWNILLKKQVLLFLEQLRASGKVGEIGFSFHDDAQVLPAILDAYAWDFVQLQINYYDWQGKQDARGQYLQARQRALPVVVMEPIRGGTLAALPGRALAALSTGGGDSPAALALRWCASLPGIRTVLSGMSDIAQLMENMAVLERDFRPLGEREYAAVERILQVLAEKELIPCTGCRYCAPECPQQINIAGLLNAVNEARQFENDKLLSNHIRDLAQGKRPEDCIACGRCHEACPQKIDIPAEVAAVAGADRQEKA